RAALGTPSTRPAPWAHSPSPKLAGHGLDRHRYPCAATTGRPPGYERLVARGPPGAPATPARYRTPRWQSRAARTSVHAGRRAPFALPPTRLRRAAEGQVRAMPAEPACRDAEQRRRFLVLEPAIRLPGGVSVGAVRGDRRRGERPNDGQRQSKELGALVGGEMDYCGGIPGEVIERHRVGGGSNFARPGNGERPTVILGSRA